MKKIILSEYGICKDTDITLKLLEIFKTNPENTEFSFEEGDYYLSPKEELIMDYRLSNTDVLPSRKLGIFLKNMKNCVLNGNGARLWFEGHMQPFTLDRCSNIEIKNFVINWKKPLVAEGIIKNITEKYADVYIDSKKFPHRLADNWLEFDVGADEWYPLWHDSHIIFEPHFRTVRRASGDSFVARSVEKIDTDLYRMTLRNPVNVMNGDIAVLRHNSRMHAGIFTEKCNDITVEDIVIHSCGGLGCLAQFCNNLTYRRIHLIPDTTAGRLITSGRDDGMHITCCSGTVNITECTFLGLMDDPINVHGCCVTSDEAVDGKTLRCNYRHEQAQGFVYWAEEGDEIAFIDRGNMSRIHTAELESYTLEKEDTFILKFKDELPKEIIEQANRGDALALDNLTHTAAFNCSNNRFGSCRARSILVSTPKPVVIENNYFESSGTSILVAGDSNFWFESGECNDVTIRNNVFTHACLTSEYQFCEGVISIYPIVPKPEIDKPYHKNIKITGNTFDTADTPVLYGYSCKNLEFSNNRIFKSNAAAKWHKRDALIGLSYCVDAKIENNEWIGKFSDEILKTENCEL